LKQKLQDNTTDNKKQQPQTASQTPTDNQSDTDAQILKIKLEALQGMLHAKNELLRVKDEQLVQAQERELFYQDELKAVRLLAAPMVKADSATPKKRRWFFGWV
jgi:hypothetical protein